VKIRVVFEYDEAFARALAATYGDKRSKRADVRQWCEMTLKATAEDVEASHADELAYEADLKARTEEGETI